MFSLTIIGFIALFVGRQQPSSTRLTRFRFTDCKPPCWIGIIPGKTTLIEAKDRLTKVFGKSSNYQITFYPDAGDRVSAKVRFLYLPEAELDITIYTHKSGKEIQGIIFYFGTPDEQNLHCEDQLPAYPTFSDIIILWGTPSHGAYPRYATGGGCTDNFHLYYARNGFVILAITRMPERVSLYRRPRGISFFANTPPAQPYPLWRGFRLLQNYLWNN